MKNYKVQAIRNFRDSNEIDKKTGLKIERTINDEFYCTKERYEFLKQNNAVKLVEIVEEENEFITPIIGQEKDEVKYIVPLGNDTEASEKLGEAIKKHIKIVEEKQEKPKTKRTTKKTSKK